MGQKSNAFLETEPVEKLMGKYAVPCIISLLAAALYNIVDQSLTAILAIWYLCHICGLYPYCRL